jgi:colanic acid/amylovoran biosynthesis glycosyltransferase
MPRRSLRLAYLTTEYPKASHTFVRREIEGLERRGHDVLRLSIRDAGSAVVDPADLRERERTIYCLKQSPSTLALAGAAAGGREPAGMARALATTLAMSKSSDRGILRHAAYLAEACFVLDQLRRHGTQHLHAHFGTNAAAVARLVRLLGGPTYSLTVHGPDEFDAPLAFDLRGKVSEAAFAAGVSSYGSAQLRRWVDPEHWSRIHVIHCTVPDAYYDHATPMQVDRPRLVCVGRLSGQKGQLVLLEAAARLKADGVPLELVLVGDGEMRSVVERSIAERGLGQTVQVTGWANEATVRKHLLEARAMVLPSFAEGLPVVIMEAMALGRPVVSTFVAGIPELVLDGKTGWLVPAGNVAALTEALRTVLSTPLAELDAMGQAGQARVRQRHGTETELDKLEALFTAAIDGKSP